MSVRCCSTRAPETATSCPSLRARSGDGWLSLGRYEFLGLADGLPAPRFAVDEWWSLGQTIDLGGRRLEVLPLPGHTPTSVGLYDGDHRLLFAGDFIYPGELYAFLPGASRAGYLATTRRLLALLDPAARVYAAHMVEDSRLIVAPVLEIDDLRALEHALIGIESGAAKSSGWYPRVFPVRGPISFATGFSWNNR